MSGDLKERARWCLRAVLGREPTCAERTRFLLAWHADAQTEAQWQAVVEWCWRQYREMEERG